MNRTTTLAVLRHPPLRRYLVNRFFASLAQLMLRATVAWQVWTQTESALWLGLVGLAFLPGLPFSLWGGSVADRADRVAIARRSQLAMLAAGLGLAAGSAVDLPGVWWIFTLIGIVAVGGAFESPARQAVLPLLVPRREFGAAVVVQSTVQNIAWLSGPVLAGLIIDVGSVAVAYGGCALAWTIALASLGGLSTPRPEGDPGRSHGDAILEGVRFVRERPALLAAMTLDLFAVVFASVTALLPIYAEQILGVGARGYGLLASALELGTVVMAVILLRRPTILRPGRALLIAVALFGLATIGFGLSRDFALSYACLVVAGMADQISMVTRGIILQLATPDALRGRVSSINMIFVASSNHLGAVESGLLAAATSATFSVVAGGLLCLGVVGWIAVGVPSLRRFRIDRDAVEEEDEPAAEAELG